MKKIILSGLITVLIASCAKVEIMAPEFEVSTAKTTYSVKDTVAFNFTGNPDNITFYSGESTHKYENINRISATPDSSLVTFSTVSTALVAASQPVALNNVSILVSKDYSGVLDAASIKKATWTDITSRAKISTNATTVASGNVHIEDQQAGTAPVYVAFRYLADTCTATSLSRKWTVSALTIKSFFKDTTNILANPTNTGGFSTGGFRVFSVLNATNIWLYANNNIAFNAPALGSSKDEDWVISRPLDLTLVANDLGVSIKNTSVRLSQYKYVFKKPGTYLVTFLVQNISSDNAIKSTKQLTLTITN